MIKVEVIEDFTLQEFNKLKNIIRKGKDEEGKLFIGDIFECDEKMADYLTGNNSINRAVVKVIEVIPDIDIDELDIDELDKLEAIKEVKEVKKPRRKRKLI